MVHVDAVGRILISILHSERSERERKRKGEMGYHSHTKTVPCSDLETFSTLRGYKFVRSNVDSIIKQYIKSPLEFHSKPNAPYYTPQTCQRHRHPCPFQAESWRTHFHSSIREIFIVCLLFCPVDVCESNGECHGTLQCLVLNYLHAELIFEIRTGFIAQAVPFPLRI